MKFQLKQSFAIESARFLPNLPKAHPCAHVHGHSFKIILTFVGEQNPKTGWVIDYHEISKKMAPLLKELDHQLLNEVEGLENPTSENLTLWIYKRAKKVLPELVRATVQETSSTECSYPA